MSLKRKIAVGGILAFSLSTANAETLQDAVDLIEQTIDELEALEY